jgi:hypothetical protein
VNFHFFIIMTRRVSTANLSRYHPLLPSPPRRPYDSARRLKRFFDSGVMGVAVKICAPDSSPWIVDGGSNSGVMKMAGKSRRRMGGIGKSVKLIGIGTAQKDVSSYETKGHSHLILAVDQDENFPQKKDKDEPDYGYEIEYTKLFEDSLSTEFGVPIVGLLGMFPLKPFEILTMFTFVFSVGGGPGSLQNVIEAIAGNFPVVVIKGTGRVADLICAIRDNKKHGSFSDVENQCKSAFSTIVLQFCFI